MQEEINVPDSLLWVLVVVLFCTWAAIFSLGMAYQASRPCDHIKPYQVPTVGGGTMLIVPEGWYAVPVLNKHGRPYMRPTDEKG